jgi:biotin-(acetyl-CoA carboxylase) ligase
LHATLPQRPFGLDHVLAAVLAAVAERFGRLQEHGAQDLLAAYRRHSAVLGRQVIVRPDERSRDGAVLCGEVVAIAPDLSLRLRDHAVPITSGRLTIVPEGT